MARLDFKRPDKIVLQGLQTLGSFGKSLYAQEKAEAKAKAELTFFEEKRTEELQKQLFTYTAESCSKQKGDFSLAPLSKHHSGTKYWLNLHGIYDVDQVEAAASAINLDRLSIRQILDTTQRPEVDGMNFEYIPELQYRYGYFITWVVMVVTTLVMLLYSDAESGYSGSVEKLTFNANLRLITS